MQNEERHKSDFLGPLEDYDNGLITCGEMECHIGRICHEYPGERETILARLFAHSETSVQEAAFRIWKLCRRVEDLTTDIEHIRRSSPLQPGAAFILSGGFSYGVTPLWLKGRACYQATFIDFVYCGTDTMPAAFVELEDEIDMTEQPSGLRHKGRHALMKLLYVADWEETGDVEVHIVGALPEDVVAFFSSHSVDLAIEPNAEYRIMHKKEEL